MIRELGVEESVRNHSVIITCALNGSHAKTQCNSIGGSKGRGRGQERAPRESNFFYFHVVFRKKLTK